MGLSNSKRPKQIEEILIKEHRRNVINHFFALQILSKEICPVDIWVHVPENGEEFNKFLEENDWIKNSTQEEMACLVKKIFTGIERGPEEIPFGEGEQILKDVFQPIKSLSKGANGITNTVGYKNSKPFAILKSTGEYEHLFKFENNIHEIVVGLILNKLRSRVPNFMYLYGGFYCAPPNLLSVVFQEYKKKEENHLKVADYFRGPIEVNKEINRMLDDNLNLSPDKRDEDISFYIELNNEYFDEIRFKFVRGKIDVKEYLQLYIKFLEDVIRRIRKNNNFRDLLHKKLEHLKTLNPNEIQEYKNLANKELESIFDENNFCNSEIDKTTLLLYEYIPHANDFTTFISNKEISIIEKENVLFQLFISYYIAHQEFSFVHYDLHGKNILVRTEEKEREIIYTFNKGSNPEDIITIKIKSRYIPQFIDYGMVIVKWNNLTFTSLNDELYPTERGFDYQKIVMSDLNNFITGLREDNILDLSPQIMDILKSLEKKDYQNWFDTLFHYLRYSKLEEELK